jgi:hypothetical protein
MFMSTSGLPLKRGKPVLSKAIVHPRRKSGIRNDLSGVGTALMRRVYEPDESRRTDPEFCCGVQRATSGAALNELARKRVQRTVKFVVFVSAVSEDGVVAP